MKRPFIFLFTALVLFCPHLMGQSGNTPYASNTTSDYRAKEYKNLISNSINKNLLLDITDSTEENWQTAFDAMELLLYRTAFTDTRIRKVMNSLGQRSSSFQTAILQLIYPLYPTDFVPQVEALAQSTHDPKLFAMCAEYLFRNGKAAIYKNMLQKRMEEIQQSSGSANELPFFTVLKSKATSSALKIPPVKDLLSSSFLPNEMVMYSFQRKNRNFPGLVLVRNKNGFFIKDTAGKYFAVPQLARSCTNMPGYLSNGNTPQGIFKVFDFAVSKSAFIGPTTNIQMVLPFEKSTDVSDSVTQTLGNQYRDMLPASWKSYFPFFEAYYAGKAGRSEIIAHGTTVNPAYYVKQPYYPLTPTQGCLCTKEIWSQADGKRKESDQQKLVDAVMKAGGANGYCVVIEIDDQQKPVALQDILPFIK